MAGPSVTHQRRREALALLGAGCGTSELTAKLAAQWGCSRRQSRRYVAHAHAELMADLDDVQAANVLATLINRLEQVSRLAAESGQHGAAVGAARLLAELVVSPHRGAHSGHIGRFGRFGSSSRS